MLFHTSEPCQRGCPPPPPHPPNPCIHLVGSYLLPKFLSGVTLSGRPPLTIPSKGKLPICFLQLLSMHVEKFFHLPGKALQPLGFLSFLVLSPPPPCLLSLSFPSSLHPSRLSHRPPPPLPTPPAARPLAPTLAPQTHRRLGCLRGQWSPLASSHRTRTMAIPFHTDSPVPASALRTVHSMPLLAQRRASGHPLATVCNIPGVSPKGPPRGLQAHPTDLSGPVMNQVWLEGMWNFSPTS